VKFANAKYAIRLPDATSYDSGFYLCIVSNDYGQLNFTVELEVVGKHQFLVQLLIGMNSMFLVVFSCKG